MKYSINNYVSAFTEAVKKVSQETAVEGFIMLLKKTGDIKYSKKIIEAVHKKIINEKGGRWVNVETARESALNKEIFKNKFAEKDHVGFKINPELVAGIRITVDGQEELDNSLEHKLKILFK